MRSTTRSPLWSLLLSISLLSSSVRAEVTVSPIEEVGTPRIEGLSAATPATPPKMTGQDRELTEVRLRRRVRSLGSEPNQVGRIFSVIGVILGGGLMIGGRTLMSAYNDNYIEVPSYFMITLGGLIFAGGVGSLVNASNYQKARTELNAEAARYGIDLSIDSKRVEESHALKTRQRFLFWGTLSAAIGAYYLVEGIFGNSDEQTRKLTLGGATLSGIGGFLLWQGFSIKPKPFMSAWLTPHITKDQATVHLGFHF